LDSVEAALKDKQVYANAAPGKMQATIEQVAARKAQIRTDIESALKYYKKGHEGMFIGDKTIGTPPSGSSIQEVTNQYVDALINQDAEPEKAKVPLEFLSDKLNAASDKMKQGIGVETSSIIRERVVEAVRIEEQAKAAQREAAARLAGESMGRRELLKKFGLGTLAAGGVAGAVALSQTGCPKPPVIAPKRELPEGFKIIKKLSSGNPPVEENAVLASESKVEKNALLFVGKNTNEINSVQGVFKDNGTTEIHITNPREHPSEITIDTPKYARTDSNAKDKDPKEKNRTKVDLCLHPSVLANYTLFANSIPNGLGEHSKDVVLNFIPKREVDAEAMKPFKIVIKGHGIDKGGVHKGGIFDQSGIDRIKIIDNTGQNLGELNLVNLPTADVFTGALNALQLEVGKSNYDSEPLKIGNPIMLERFANKRRLDLSQSHGQGGISLLPIRSGGVGGRG
jgi:hypothetical protein